MGNVVDAGKFVTEQLGILGKVVVETVKSEADYFTAFDRLGMARTPKDYERVQDYLDDAKTHARAVDDAVNSLNPFIPGLLDAFRK